MGGGSWYAGGWYPTSTTGGTAPGIHIDLTGMTESWTASDASTTAGGYTAQVSVAASSTLSLSSSGLGVSGGTGVCYLNFTDFTEMDPNWDGTKGIIAAIAFDGGFSAGARIQLTIYSPGSVATSAYTDACGVRHIYGTELQSVLKWNTSWQADNTGAETDTLIGIALQSTGQGVMGAGETTAIPQPPLPRLCSNADMANHGDQDHQAARLLFQAGRAANQCTLLLDNAGARGGFITDAWLIDVARMEDNTSYTEV